MAEWDQTGRSSWVSDLAEIPEKYGVTNVYGDLGQIFAWTTVAEPRLAAAMMGTLIKGLGADHVIWGTDAVWTGSPQWQIEGLRRLEIPEDMQKKYGFPPLGAADGAGQERDLRRQCGCASSATTRRAELGDAGPLRRDQGAATSRAGRARSNLRYGYIAKPA